MRTALIFAIWVALVTVAAAAPTAPDDLDTRLAVAADGLLADLAKHNPDGKACTLAAVPLVEAGQERVRRLGVAAAESVERRLTEKKPAWLRVQTRMNLAALHAEHRLWISDLVKPLPPSEQPPEGLVDRADYLVAGTLTVADKAVSLELRLVGTRTGDVVAARQVSIDRTPQIDALLAYVQHGGNGRDDVAPAGTIKVAVTAQRADAAGAKVREWTVKPGETLRGGDQFRLGFSMDADAYVTVLLYGSDRKAAVLFPNAEFAQEFGRRFGRAMTPQEAYCRAEWDYSAPGLDANREEAFYKLDNTPGRNVVYLAASRDQPRNLDDIRRRLEQAPSDAERLSLLRDKAGFDAVETFEFRQE